ncbi:hypothetical protein BYT27DRAFT_7103704, partial [Phlegmacium glaucopus]
DMSKRIEVHARDEILYFKNTVNGMVISSLLRALAADVTRVTLEVRSQGKLGGQAHVSDVEGLWLNLVRNVCVSVLHDALDENLSFDRVNRITDQVRSIAVVTTAVARGDLTQKIEISEMLDLKMTVNFMVAQLSALANKVTQVSLEVGMEGILGG